MLSNSSISSSHCPKLHRVHTRAVWSRTITSLSWPVILWLMHPRTQLALPAAWTPCWQFTINPEPQIILWCQGSGSQGKLTWGRAWRRKSYHVEGWYFFFFWKTSLKHSTPLLMHQRDRDGISRFFLFAALAVVHVWVFVPCSKTYGKLLAHMGLERASVRQFKLQNNQKTGFAFQAGECGNHLTLSRLSSLCHFYIFCSDYIHFLCLPFCQDLSATQIPVKIVFRNHGISHCEHIWSEHFWCSHPFSLW